MAADGLIALKTAPPSVDAEDAEYLARTLYGVAARATLLAGERDRNFRLATEEGKDYILKVIDSMADAATVECQANAVPARRPRGPGRRRPYRRAVEQGALRRGLTRENPIREKLRGG